MIEANPYAAAGFTVLKVETHLHTLHSDGQHSVADMFEACRGAGYGAVAITDHNTQSGLPEAVEAADRLGLILLPGVEITTFRGHAVVLGITRVPEWRNLEQRGMDALAREVHADGGLLCVAHPPAFGSPVCSGCAWDWPFEPASVDMWEVFSAPRPIITESALALWRQLLARGGYVAGLAAGDVHSVTAAAQPKKATHVYVRERTTADVLEALRARRVFASGGERLDFWLAGSDGQVALAGSRVATGDWQPRAGASSAGQVEVEEVDLADGGRCLFAVRRDADHLLEALSAPIWIETSH